MKSSHNVLFVDDEENILSALRRGLIDEEYECLFASSGEEALKILKTTNISVIVSDMKMPGMDGLTLLKEVRLLYPKTVRIVLSGYAQLQQVLATVNQADIFRFITKPWKLEAEFKEAVNKALEYHKLQVDRDAFENALTSKNIAYQNILKRIEEVISCSRLKTDLICSVGNYFFESILKQLKDDSNYYKGALKAEIATELFSLLSKQNMSETGEKTPAEIVSLITGTLKTLKSISSFELENKITRTSNTKPHIAALISFIYICTSIFVEGFENSSVKASLQDEGNHNDNKISCSMIISCNMSTSSTESKIKYQHKIEMAVEMLNKAIGEAMKIVQGNFECTKVESRIVQKFIF